jgi:hypothetical protein
MNALAVTLHLIYWSAKIAYKREVIAGNGLTSLAVQFSPLAKPVNNQQANSSLGDRRARFASFAYCLSIAALLGTPVWNQRGS